MFTSASNVAGGADRVFLFIVGLSAFVLLGITAAMVLFVVRYARRRRPTAEQIEGNLALEVVWTVLPTLLFVSMFAYGWSIWRGGRAGPDDAERVKVTGRQFAWSFTYASGKTTQQLVLPLGRPVRLDVTSVDVVHGFFVPAFRAKVDAVPGRTNYTFLTPTALGTYDIECTVICGPIHSYMLSKAHVVPSETYAAWAAGPETEPPAAGAPPAPVVARVEPAARGKALAEAQGCIACHSVDGAAAVGPTFRGLWGRRETLESGKQVVVDEPYAIRSIRTPSADVVKGYPDAMPQLPLTDAQIEDLIAWLKTL